MVFHAISVLACNAHKRVSFFYDIMAYIGNETRKRAGPLLNCFVRPGELN